MRELQYIAGRSPPCAKGVSEGSHRCQRPIPREVLEEEVHKHHQWGVFHGFKSVQIEDTR